MSDAVSTFWKNKLIALLHDSPDKCFAIARHEAAADHAQAGAGFVDEAERRTLAAHVKAADIFASSAERFVFPQKKCTHSFAESPLFIHPLSSVPYEFSAAFMKTPANLADAVQSAVGGVGTTDWHATFFLYWRRWLDNAAATYPDLSFLPADTRIPDHTIWTHMAVSSALASCMAGGTVQPELVLFQTGAVQDFIAQSRSTRDLWSGSYLLSWLMAHAIKAVTDEIGPDAVIFPSLRGNGIFDALHRQSYYATAWKSGVNGVTETTWERLLKDKGDWNKMADWLLTPTLPNRFLAMVPPGRGEELATKAQQALLGELHNVGDAVWTWLVSQGAKPEWKMRWNAQLDAFPQTAWAVQPWLENRELCLAETARLPVNADDPEGVAGRIRAMLVLGEQRLPQEDRDARYYTDKTKKERLANSGLLWSAHYALLDAKLAARRNTRDFAAWRDPFPEAAVKDSLSGKEACIGDESFWKSLSGHALFRNAPSHRYGAMNLLKRLWCRGDCVPYLRERLGLAVEPYRKALRFDALDEVSKPDRYVAILALDGDHMGKWVSGANTPELLRQFAPKAHNYLLDKAGSVKRLLTPSYHLQFSEALANFAMHKARAVVESHGGELIYAGGDDVLAILPAKQAVACAEALRAAFRTDFDGGKLYPGACCEVSCGLAVGHVNAPLQMLVHEARQAERRAKRDYGRAALAVSLYKRSGEIIEWGCKWKGPALPLMRTLTAADKLSGRFPYALAALLKPYALQGAMPDMLPVLQNEVRRVLDQQGADLPEDERKALAAGIDDYLESTKFRLQDFINLFLAETFINRSREEK